KAHDESDDCRPYSVWCTLDGVPPREREDVHRRATFAEADSERGQSFEIIDLIMRMQRQKSGRAARVSERAPKRNRAKKRNASSGNAINIQHLTGKSIREWSPFCLRSEIRFEVPLF
ncbi:hypothetical protein ALC60_05873, partial [Trachymyrmex zeteki]